MLLDAAECIWRLFCGKIRFSYITDNFIRFEHLRAFDFCVLGNSSQGVLSGCFYMKNM